MFAPYHACETQGGSSLPIPPPSAPSRQGPTSNLAKPTDKTNNQSEQVRDVNRVKRAPHVVAATRLMIVGRTVKIRPDLSDFKNRVTLQERARERRPAASGGKTILLYRSHSFNARNQHRETIVLLLPAKDPAVVFYGISHVN